MYLYTVRHPQTEWHLQKRIQWWMDSPLTELGKSIAISLGEALRDKRIEKIISSDLGRCIQTAEIISSILRVPFLKIPELREQNFGQFNGEPNERVRHALDLTDPDAIVAGGESFNDMKARVLSIVDKICLLGHEWSVLIVTHDGCVRALLSHAHDCDFNDVRCDTTTRSICRFDFSEKKFRFLEETVVD